MSARLIYLMDPLCAWCWGFAPVVEALAATAAAAGVPLDLVLGGLRQERAALQPAARQRILDHWQVVQANTGQPFNLADALPEGFIYDTEPACRALVVARQLDKGSAWALLQAIQRAFYLEGRDPSRADVLRELAEQVGLARREFAPAFDAPAARQATAGDFAWARNLGIAGFPTLLAERAGQLALLTNGYQPLDRLAPLLGRWQRRGAGEPADGSPAH